MTWPKDENATEEERKKKEKPVSPLFIFNATFEATKECEAGKPDFDRYATFCSSAVSFVLPSCNHVCPPVGQGV